MLRTAKTRRKSPYVRRPTHQDVLVQHLVPGDVLLVEMTDTGEDSKGTVNRVEVDLEMGMVAFETKETRGGAPMVGQAPIGTVFSVEPRLLQDS